MVLVNKVSDTKKRVLACVNASLEKKATNIVIMKVQEMSAFTDYFVIVSGNSDRQVQAIAAAIRENMKKEGLLPLGIEGENHGQWVLMDYGDVIVHIFYAPVREFYNIERLWSDAPTMEVAEDVPRLKALAKGM